MRGDVLRGGIGERVGMRVNESGNDGVRGEIGNRDAAGRRVCDGLDAIAGDEDVSARMHGASADVDEFAGEHGLRHCWSIGLLTMHCGGGKEEGDKETAA